MIDRSTAPATGIIDKVDFVKPVKKVLKNGIPFFELKAGAQPVLRLEFFIHAGSKYQSKVLQAGFTASQLSEGTKSFNAKQIADRLEYFGAFTQAETEDEYMVFTLHCLSKNFKDVWPVIKEIILSPVFPEQELKTAIKNGKQKLSVNLNKVEFIARREFSHTLFGNHPYGKKAELVDYDNLTVADLQSYYKNYFNSGNCTIIASGNFDESVEKLMNEEFELPDEKTDFPSFRFENILPIKKMIPKAGSVQNGIRMGKILFNRTHPDFLGVNVLNTLLGGYFGSRLMANIREDKGFTYGIGSALAGFHDTGVFLIATEVGSEVCKDALKEIYKEIDLLRNEKASDEELKLVKNYMLGSFLRNSDGPFAMADRFKTIHFSGLDYSYYDRYFETVNTITSERIQELAVKYFDPESMTEVVVGEEK